MQKILAALLIFSACAGIACAEERSPSAGIDLPFDQGSALRAVQAVAEGRGLKFPISYRPTCGKASPAAEALYYCEHEFFGSKVRFWSIDEAAKVSLITARPLRDAPYSRWLIAISLVIATVDGSLNDDEIRDIAERLATAGRNLSGTSTQTSRNGVFASRIGPQGPTVIAIRAPR